MNIVPNQGLPENVINSKKSVLKDVSKLDSDKSSCLICLEEFTNNTEIVVFPCLHFFHFLCGKKWLLESKLCPICKCPI